jgi:hypothetical protein
LTAVGTADEMILWDSAYWLGTKFFNSRNTSKQYAEIQYLVLGTSSSSDSHISYCSFRHFDIALHCYQMALNNPVENSIFQFNYRPIYCNKTTNTSGTPFMIRNNLFQYWEMQAILTGTLSPTHLYLNVQDNTFMYGPTACYMQSWSYMHIYVYWNRNIVSNCSSYGIGGYPTNGSGYANSYFHCYFVDEDDNIFWNNGLNVDTDYLDFKIDGVSEDDSPTSQNPLHVSLASATQEKALAGVYLSQQSGDASQLPFAVWDDCFDVDDPLENVTNWPSGNWDVEIYGLDDINQWSSSPDPVLEISISNSGSTLGTPSTSYNDLGNMLIVITNSSSGGDPTSIPYFDAVFDNGSRIRVYFSIADLTGIGVGESLAFWVALDGSTYYARANQASTSTHNDQVDQNALYAMREDSTGLAQGAKAGGVADSPAIDIAGTGYFSEGYTSTAGGVDYYPIDAGFHYGGSVTEDSTAPSDSDLTITEDSLYLYANTSASFYYNNQNGESFILNATMGTETNPWQLTWAAAFATPLLTESDSAPNTRAYTLDSSTSTGSVSTIFRDKAGNEETETVTYTYDGTAPACTVTTATGAVLSGTQTISGTATDGGSGVRGAAFYWDLNDNGQADPMEKLGDAEESGGSWQLSWVTTNLFNGYHRLIIVAEDNVSNTNTDTDQYVFVANGGFPAMIAPTNDKVFYFASDCTDVSFEVTFVGGESDVENILYQVNSFSGTWMNFYDNGTSDPATTTCTVSTATFASLDTGLHIVYLKAIELEPQTASGTNGEWKVYIFKKPPGTGGNTPEGGCQQTCTF